MAWRLRFWRTAKLLPGVRLNVSRSGPSVSVGPRGSKITIGRKGVRRTVGVPGTGLFATDFQPWAPGVDATDAVEAPTEAGDHPSGRPAGSPVAPVPALVRPPVRCGFCGGRGGPDGRCTMCGQQVTESG